MVKEYKEYGKVEYSIGTNPVSAEMVKDVNCEEAFVIERIDKNDPNPLQAIVEFVKEHLDYPIIFKAEKKITSDNLIFLSAVLTQDVRCLDFVFSDDDAIYFLCMEGVGAEIYAKLSQYIASASVHDAMLDDEVFAMVFGNLGTSSTFTENGWEKLQQFAPEEVRAASGF